MANTEVGTAYVSIMPSMKGFQQQLSQGVGGAFKKASAIGIAAVGGLAAVTAGLGKQALSAFADYQQLTGGVDKLFGEASKTVQDYAANAYKTAGVSANEYMQNVTSFSASLISSLGGDTAAAAEYAHKAMVDMSDNANTFGTDMRSVQDAYQGFAKQNYTMLDNLKLGYGGTKSEMERLISDANKVKEAHGEMANLSIEKFSDVVEAIHTIQNEQKITGTTAKEAADTISGSIASAKGAFSNWLSGLAQDNADMGDLTDRLLEAVGNVAKNVFPRIAKIGETLIKSLPDFAKRMGKALVDLLKEAIKNAWNAISDVLKGLNIELPKIDTEEISKFFDTIGKAAPFLMPFVIALGALAAGLAGLAACKAVFSMISTGINGICSAFTGLRAAMAAHPILTIITIAVAAGMAIKNLWDTNEGFRNGVIAAWEAISGAVAPVIEFIMNLVTGIIEGFNAAKDAVVGAFTWISERAGEVINGIIQFFIDLPGNILGALAGLGEMIGGVFSGLGDFAGQAVTAIIQFFISLPGNIWNAICTIGQTVWNALCGLGEMAGRAINAVLQFFISLPGNIWNAICTIGQTVWNALCGLGELAGKAIEAVLKFFIDLPGNIWNAICSIADTVWKALCGLGELAGKAIEAVLKFFIDLPGNIWNGICTIGDTVWKALCGLGDLAGKAVDDILGFFRDLPGNIWDFICKIPDKFAEMFGNIHIPTFHLEGEFNLLCWPPKIPQLKFYASGGIVGQGFGGAHLGIVGESRVPEMITPLQGRAMQPFADEISRRMSVAGMTRDDFRKAVADALIEVMPDVIANYTPTIGRRDLRREVGYV